MRSLRYLNSILTVLAVLLSLNLYIAWSDSPVSAVSEAQAQGVTNAGAQREEMVGLLKQLNVHMAELNKGLKQGAFRVRVQAAEDK